MADVIKEVERLEGVAIAAHIDRAKTGFEMRETGYPDWKTDVVVRPGLYGPSSITLIISRGTAKKTPTPRTAPSVGKLPRPGRLRARTTFAPVQNSDAHSLKELSERFAGKSLTKFKMAI